MAKKYEEGWKKHKNLFSNGSTPLLEEFIGKLGSTPSKNGNSKRVVEAGAGNGIHTLAIAAKGHHVETVEFSPDAVNLILEKQRLLGRQGNLVSIFNWEIMDYLEYLESVRLAKSPLHQAQPIDGFYANSVLHTFSEKSRQLLYGKIAALQPKGGLIAVSFKTDKDVKYREGIVTNETPAGKIKKSDDGIERLFVSTPGVIAKEIEGFGYRIEEGGVFQWGCQDYDYPGKVSWFVGFLGEKQAKNI